MSQRQNKVNTNLCDVFHRGHVHNTKSAIASGVAKHVPYILVSHFFSKLLHNFRKFHSLNDGSQDDWRGNVLQPVLSEPAVGIALVILYQPYSIWCKKDIETQPEFKPRSSEF